MALDHFYDPFNPLGDVDFDVDDDDDDDVDVDVAKLELVRQAESHMRLPGYKLNLAKVEARKAALMGVQDFMDSMALDKVDGLVPYLAIILFDLYFSAHDDVDSTDLYWACLKIASKMRGETIDLKEKDNDKLERTVTQVKSQLTRTIVTPLYFISTTLQAIPSIKFYKPWYLYWVCMNCVADVGSCEYTPSQIAAACITPFFRYYPGGADERAAADKAKSDLAIKCKLAEHEFHELSGVLISVADWNVSAVEGEPSSVMAYVAAVEEDNPVVKEDLPEVEEAKPVEMEEDSVIPKHKQAIGLMKEEEEARKKRERDIEIENTAAKRASPAGRLLATGRESFASAMKANHPCYEGGNPCCEVNHKQGCEGNHKQGCGN